ncbi:MAG: S-layer homology domain-containing protein, partial [Sedimentibacter sp.]
NLSVLVNNKAISSFGGKVKVSIPYVLKENEEPAGVVVWYMNDIGVLSDIESTYDVATGMVTFETEHFSYYLVGYDESKELMLPFTDVDEGAWYYEAVTFAYERSLYFGTSENTFEPESNMTRAMFVTVLGRLAKIDTSLYEGSCFKDVLTGKWYSPYIEWAVEHEIVTGYNDELFGTDDFITREQMTVIIARYIENMKANISFTPIGYVPYEDEIEIADWAENSVVLLQVRGLIHGVGNNKFAPKKSVTRAETATILMNISERSTK